MCRDSSLSSHAGVLSDLVPESEPPAGETVHSLLGLASASPGSAGGPDLERLARAEEALDGRLQHLRDTHVAAPFSLDRMASVLVVRRRISVGAFFLATRSQAGQVSSRRG
jgi:hypothetical protein